MGVKRYCSSRGRTCVVVVREHLAEGNTLKPVLNETWLYGRPVLAENIYSLKYQVSRISRLKVCLLNVTCLQRKQFRSVAVYLLAISLYFGLKNEEESGCWRKWHIDLCGRIILKQILNKQRERVGFIWLRATSGVLLWTRWWSIGLHQIWWLSCLGWVLYVSRTDALYRSAGRFYQKVLHYSVSFLSALKSLMIGRRSE
jgi:uncharacterized membrane protein